MKIGIALLPLLLIGSVAKSQINGIVRDSDSQAPLVGAHIFFDAKMTTSGTAGDFTLPDKTASIIISHVGYISDTIYEFTEGFIVSLSPSFENLEQIIVHATQYQHKLISIPSSISLILLENQSTGISYLEKLNQAPGVFVHTGTLNTNRITIRGVGSRTPYGTNRIKAYFNGIPLSSGDGSTEIEDLNQHSIKTIEILKGAKSGIYGAGLGGVMLLSNAKPAKNGLHGDVGFLMASYRTINPNINLEYKKDNFSISTQYAFASAEGWRQNNNYQRHNFNSVANYYTNKTSTEFILQYINTNAQIPSSLNINTFNNAPDSAAQNWLKINGFEDYSKLLTGISHKQQLGGNFENTTLIYANLYKGYESRPFNVLDDNALKAGVKNTLLFTQHNYQLLAGFELMHETYNWSIFETIDGTEGSELNRFSEIRTPLNLFLSGSYNFDNGSILEGGFSYNFLNYTLVDQFKTSVDRSGEYKYTPVISPFLGVNIPIKNQFNLYASISHGYAPPTVEETLLPNGEINPDLRPETGINAEAGVRFSSARNIIFIDAGLYTIWLDNLLVTERESEAIFYTQNAGKTTQKGFELASTLRLNALENYRLPKTNISLSYNISNNIFTDFTDDGIDYSNNVIPGIPNQTFWTKVHLSYQWGLYFSYEVQSIGSQYLNDSNTDTYGPYLINNINLGYGKVNKYEFGFGIQNLLNTHYASMILVNAPSFGASLPRYYYPGMPRNFYASIMWKF